MSQIIPIYIPTYISDQNYNPARILPRLFFYNGLIGCEQYYIQDENFSSRAQQEFPYFDNYNVVSGDFPTTDSLSLLFNNENASYGEVPTDSLYTTYWSKYVELLYNPKTRLLNASAIIPLADYFNMELNDVVNFRGNYYHLRAINDYSVKTGECNLQLLGPIIPDTLYRPLDIVRDGLVFAFDWTSFNSNGTLTDKSENNFGANWYGNLTKASNALQFDGTSSYIEFNIDANEMYQSWKWTVDTYGVINDIDNTTEYGRLIAYNNTNGATTFPEWQFSIQTSGSTTPDLISWNALITTKDAPITASLTLPHQFTYIGRQSGSGGLSEVTLSMDTNPLSGSGTGTNIVPGRTFNGNGSFPGAASSSSLQYFGGPEITYTPPFGAPFVSNPLSGSIQYILYYNRDLTQAELEQNNKFYLVNNPITKKN